MQIYQGVADMFEEIPDVRRRIFASQAENQSPKQVRVQSINIHVKVRCAKG